MAAGTTAVAGVGSANAATPAAKGESNRAGEIQVTDIEGEAKGDFRDKALNSDVFSQVAEKIQTQRQAEIRVEEVQVRNILFENTEAASGDVESYHVSFPLEFDTNDHNQRRRNRGEERGRGEEQGRGRAGAGRESTEVKGDVTVEIRDGVPQQAVAAVKKLNADGLVKEITTFQASSQEVASAGDSSGINSETHEVFNDNNELILDEELRPSGSDGTAKIQATGSPVCEFCKGIGNVICSLGCGVTTSLILASSTVAPPASIVAGAVVTAFCGLVTHYNDTFGKAGCGADWTVEQICAELYNNCEDDDPVY